MTKPVTPNIGLNKIDRTSPSTTYFDLEKYIDQNADAVDRFAGESGEAIGALEKRLDTEEHREVVLQPGLQIVNAERSAPFKLSGIKGRTLVNLLGRDGNFETIIPTVLNASTISALDNTSMYSGSNSIKVTAIGSETVEHYADMTAGYKAKQGSYYVLIGMLKVNKGAAQIKIYNNKPQLSPEFFISESNIVSQTGAFSLVRTAFNPIVDCDVIPRLYLLKDPSTSLYVQNGESANFDCIRMFEVSKQEYDSFGSLTFEQIAAKYPYVDSVQPVRNPYAIRYGENLAPTLFEGSVESSTKVLSEYSAIVKATGATIVEYRSKLIPAIPNTNYTLRAKITLNGLEKYDGVYVDVLGYDEAGFYVLDTPGTSVSGKGIGTDIFATPANIKTMEVRIVAPQGATVGDYVIEDITLNLGVTVKTHNPREDCILTLQTDLYSDPVTGMNADEIFEKGGQYTKLAKWKKIVLDDRFNWSFVSHYSGYKTVNIPGFSDAPYFSNPNASHLAQAMKYDGKILDLGIVTAGADKYQNSSNGNFYMNIASADSGWGDNYRPTDEEMKAYFMGWRMFQWGAGPATPYNGTGSKGWGKIYCGVGTNDQGAVAGSGIQAIPTVMNDQGYKPYQLVYQLATPTVEPIVSEGMLTFNEGDNQIEVGTGVVVRESTKPKLSIVWNTYEINSSNPNSSNVASNPLQHKARKVLRVYRNGMPDNWVIFSDINAHGIERAFIDASLFDTSAAYSVTYLMLDKLPIVPFSGSYAANEKAILKDLTDAVQQNTTAVSVLMNKKEDKDAPGWITPTLLNGWTIGTAVGYLKESNGTVQLKGILRPGSSGTIMFILPPGYRPLPKRNLAGIAYNGSTSTLHPALITILENGAVYADFSSGATWVSIDGITFLAEQ